jgi:lysophospholipase L1-like esterase
MVQESSLTFAALGDSTGVGVGASDGRGYVVRVFERLVRSVPGATLLNFSAIGATTRSVRELQLSRALEAKPELLTLFAGVNDLWYGGHERTFATQIDFLCARIAARGRYVIVGTLPNVANAPAASYAERLLGVKAHALEHRLRAFNRHIVDAVHRNGHQLLDLFAVALADVPHYFCSDGFHPSEDGYEAWAAHLWPLIEEWLRGAGRGGLAV